jgi:hypothetical protein
MTWCNLMGTCQLFEGNFFLHSEFTNTLKMEAYFFYKSLVSNCITIVSYSTIALNNDHHDASSQILLWWYNQETRDGWWQVAGKTKNENGKSNDLEQLKRIRHWEKNTGRWEYSTNKMTVTRNNANKCGLVSSGIAEWPVAVSCEKNKRSFGPEGCAILGFYAAYNDSFLTTFRDNISVPSSRVKQSYEKQPIS